MVLLDLNKPHPAILDQRQKLQILNKVSLIGLSPCPLLVKTGTSSKMGVVAHDYHTMAVELHAALQTTKGRRAFLGGNSAVKSQVKEI